MAEENRPALYVRSAVRRFLPIGNEIDKALSSGELSGEECFRLGKLIHEEIDGIQFRFCFDPSQVQPLLLQQATPTTQAPQVTQAAAAEPTLQVAEASPVQQESSRLLRESYKVSYQDLPSSEQPVAHQKVRFAPQVRVVSIDPLPCTLRSADDVMSAEVFTDVAGPNVKYKPASMENLEVQTDVQCTVTHVHDGQREFYVVPNEWMKELEALTNTLQGLAKKMQAAKVGLPAPLTPGMPCLCPHDEDNNWYRAKVEEVLGQDSVRVRFVDFGNVRLVAPNQMMPIPKMLAELCQLAIRCFTIPLNPTPDSSNAFKRCYYDDNDQVVVNFQECNTERDSFSVVVRTFRK